MSNIWAGGFETSTLEELNYMDVYNFGELILEVLSNGRVSNTSEITENAKQDNLVMEVANENGINPSKVNSVVEVALLCTRGRPSMQEALKLLSGLKSV